MLLEPYESIGRQLAGLGLIAGLRNDDQLIVSTQEEPVWPNRGISFWLSHRSGAWHICTWFGTAYRVPDGQDITALCVGCMMASNTAMYRVPENIVDQFKLYELSEQEFDAVFPESAES